MFISPQVQQFYHRAVINHRPEISQVFSTIVQSWGLVNARAWEEGKFYNHKWLLEAEVLGWANIHLAICIQPDPGQPLQYCFQVMRRHENGRYEKICSFSPQNMYALLAFLQSQPPAFFAESWPC